MSSKGRAASGYVPDPTGFFATPEYSTRAVIPKLGIKPGMRILESGCGKGAIARVLREEFGKDLHITGVEIDKRRAKQAAKATVDGRLVFDAVITGDFLKLTPPSDFEKFDLDLSNPWFAIFQKVAEQSFRFCKRTCLLLPVGSLASKGRFDWWEQHPAHMRILDKRPSFAKSVKCSTGKDNCTYQVLVATDEKHAKVCPVCERHGRGAQPTTVTSSDSNEYGFFEWGPEITEGKWSGLRTPPLKKATP
jgi:ubiquinone/menaquinone biosynthesis C-methylase UbiE